MSKKLEIYVDGSCLMHTRWRKAGWGLVAFMDGEVVYKDGDLVCLDCGERDHTHNVAELTAVKEALLFIKNWSEKVAGEKVNCIIKSDSEYALNAAFPVDFMTGSWDFKKNAQRIKELRELADEVKAAGFTFAAEWLRGLDNKADAVAKAAAHGRKIENPFIDLEDPAFLKKIENAKGVAAMCLERNLSIGYANGDFLNARGKYPSGWDNFALSLEYLKSASDAVFEDNWMSSLPSFEEEMNQKQLAMAKEAFEVILNRLDPKMPIGEGTLADFVARELEKFEKAAA